MIRARSAMGLILLGLAGCAGNLAPWERGYLARPDMALDPYPVETAFREHIYFSREGAWGGSAVGGGGCGCN